VQQPSVAPSVSPDQAQQIAQQWLDQHQSGSTTETADAFPGYYTLHIAKDGTLTGMLSVNAYTGQVWYHSWHGAFVASTEV
jgi:heat shock protein HslJ